MKARRRFLRGILASAATGVGGGLGVNHRAQGQSSQAPVRTEGAFLDGFAKLPQIRARPDRIIKETPGLRPFRKSGPRVELEHFGDQVVVHNYGHGGAGWTLSWGCARQVRELVRNHSPDRAKPVMVIGSGISGLATAITLQRAGYGVEIHAEARHPEITSSAATAVWAPDSWLCLDGHFAPEFPAWWEQTCRASYRALQQMLGLPGNPVEWVDGFIATEQSPKEIRQAIETRPGPKFARFRSRISDLFPHLHTLEPHQHPFAARHVRLGSELLFNIPAYMHYLEDKFSSQGGRFVQKKFESHEEILALNAPVSINCTGLSARHLFGDEQMMPIWGQMTFLIPQPEIRYRFANDLAYCIPRRDGIAVAMHNNGALGVEMALPNRSISIQAVNAIAQSMRRMRIT